VRGRPTAEELAAVVAAVRRARSAAAYERWRAGRLAALRTDPWRPPPPR
jgi:hypothetical protein